MQLTVAYLSTPSSESRQHCSSFWYLCVHFANKYILSTFFLILDIYKAPGGERQKVRERIHAPRSRGVEKITQPSSSFSTTSSSVQKKGGDRA
jgi:hypothetical protein